MIDILLRLGFYLFPMLMIAAALSDIHRLTIPNAIGAALVLVFPVVGFTAGMDAGQFGLHAAIAAAALLLGFALFAANIMGAGDGKLLAAALLWIGPQGAAVFILIMSFAALLMCVAVLAYRSYPVPLPVGWAARLHSPKGAVPFGVAIAGGALGAIPHTPWLMALIL